MAQKEKKIILFFINGSQPSKEELAVAEKLDTMRFRNARFIDPSAPLERCDAVAGCAPAGYLKKYPKADAPDSSETGDKKPADPPKPPAPEGTPPVATPPASGNPPWGNQTPPPPPPPAKPKK